MDKYRFLIKDKDGFSQNIEQMYGCVQDAINAAKSLTTDTDFVESVTLYLLLTSDSCGPIRYIGYYEYGNIQFDF